MPAPLVSAEVDLRGMSSFMLDVDRLLASELVALGTPEECWAATMLWCRAWKQVPAASLPDDDRVLAAFSGAGKRWPKVRDMALRGFVKCDDGRLYHHVLAGEANAAWKRRQAYSEKRERDAERLRSWRATKQEGNAGETRDETHSETRFVAERDRDRDVTEVSNNKKGSEPNGSGGEPPSTSEFIYAKGRELLAKDPKKPKDPGALISKWLRESGDDSVMAAFRACEAKRTPEPIRFITAMLGKSGRSDDLYRGVI